MSPLSSLALRIYAGLFVTETRNTKRMASSKFVENKINMNAIPIFFIVSGEFDGRGFSVSYTLEQIYSMDNEICRCLRLEFKEPIRELLLTRPNENFPVTIRRSPQDFGSIKRVGQNEYELYNYVD